MAAKIDVISGFLGAGKTTLINRLLEIIPQTDTVAIVENEFGEISIDGQILAESGVKVREISAGCICCTLFGDFVAAMTQLLDKYPLTRIIVEPTGIGRLSDVITACRNVSKTNDAELNMLITVVDSLNYEMHSKMFGEFFFDQIENANTIFLSRTQKAGNDMLSTLVKQIETVAPNATIITTPWDEMTGEQIVEIGEQRPFNPDTFIDDIFKMQSLDDKKFQVWNKTTNQTYYRNQIRQILEALENREAFATVVRGKGILQTPDDGFLLFDYVPGEISIKKMDYKGEGKIVIIGKEIDPVKLASLFGFS